MHSKCYLRYINFRWNCYKRWTDKFHFRMGFKQKMNRNHPFRTDILFAIAITYLFLNFFSHSQMKGKIYGYKYWQAHLIVNLLQCIGVNESPSSQVFAKDLKFFVSVRKVLCNPKIFILPFPFTVFQLSTSKSDIVLVYVGNHTLPTTNKELISLLQVFTYAKCHGIRHFPNHFTACLAECYLDS